MALIVNPGALEFHELKSPGQPFGDSQVVLIPPVNAGGRRDAGSILRSGRPPGGGHGNPLQHPCLENPTDRGAWRAPVHRSQSQTRLKQLSTPASQPCRSPTCKMEPGGRRTPHHRTGPRKQPWEGTSEELALSRHS